MGRRRHNHPAPPRRNDPPWALLLTCIMSHATIIPTIRLMWERRWLYECSFFTMGLICSFMYHTTQAYDTVILLPELRWHLLDNVFVIAGFVNSFTYLAVITDVKLDFGLKVLGAFCGLIAQVRAPWRESHTIVPIAVYALLPIGWIVFVHKSLRNYNLKLCTVGLGLWFTAMPFFFMGLDGMNDPYRIYHGLWHVFVGLSSYCMWRVVKVPGAVQAQAIMFGDDAQSLMASRRKEREMRERDGDVDTTNSSNSITKGGGVAVVAVGGSVVPNNSTPQDGWV